MIFTSANGVRFFFHRLEALGKDLRALHGIKIGAIGPATADAIRSRHLRPDVVPEKYQAESLLEAFSHIPMAGQRVLIPRAEVAREILPRGLEGMGAQVTVVTAYRTLPAREGAEAFRQKLALGEIDCLTFTSSSTVLNFLALFPREEILPLLKKVAVACIGPITRRTAEDNGLSVAVQAETFTLPGLVEAIEGYFTGKENS